MIEDGLKSLDGQLQNSLNPDFNPRTIVGDNYANPNERGYGNTRRDGSRGPKFHGTHVAGIIGAVRGNGVGIDGIAPAVKFMMIRTVPDGDERDKDVANAIRFAADNGAQIISMSFGKAYLPYKSRGGRSGDASTPIAKGTPMRVHAAGNDGADLALGKNFPTAEYTGGGRPQNWIEVGASVREVGATAWLPSFSNYAAERSSTCSRRGWISSPASRATSTSAIAARAWPRRSSRPRRADHGLLPEPLGGGRQEGDHGLGDPRQSDGRAAGEGAGKVPFSSLSVTGGIVNAYNAIKMAEEMSTGKARPSSNRRYG